MHKGTEERAHGAATILAIGTANPPNVMYQSDYPDFYFRVTDSEHMTDLKLKFKSSCERYGVKKRHMLINEDIVKHNPHLRDYNASSLNTRLDILNNEVPKLGRDAAIKAIKEWGQPKHKITHLIFCTLSSIDMPGADYQLTRLLDLKPSVNRTMIYYQGCYAAGTALRLAKDIAENNRAARVLVVCSEISLITFRGPSETDMVSMGNQAILGDGSAAVIVGCDPNEPLERPLFELIYATQVIVPNSEGVVEAHLREGGTYTNVRNDLPKILSSHLKTTIFESLDVVEDGVNDLNSIFWVVHPGFALLDNVELELGLDKDKLRVSKHAWSEYGNMASATVLFILDEMRRRSFDQGKSTTGEGFKWGVLLAYGPGVTVETLVLRSVPISLEE